MNHAERWQMYSKIHELKGLNLKIAQIARHVGVSRNTVYKYIDMAPAEYHRHLERRGSRKKKLDSYKSQILDWLKQYPDLSAAQIYDWLQERHTEIDVSEKTVGNLVNRLRREHTIPKTVCQRQYEAIPDPPMGYQVQVDFGEDKLKDPDGILHKLWFIAFVLSNSRQKYVEWLDRPYTTADLIRAHENCLQYYGGMPAEFVYDQDHLVLVSENNGDLIYTHEFAAYRKQREFKTYMCRKSDPESKGRIENVVGYIKKNFAKHRIYYNLDKLNEQCLDWLERTGNGKMHNTTKKVPAEVFLEEKKHLRPVPTTITIKSTTGSISRLVRKDNTISYQGNRYSVPLGTYNGDAEKEVKIHVENKDMLVISDMETGFEITRHLLCHEKGKLIKNNNHSRDRSKGIPEYLVRVTKLLGNTTKARDFLDRICELKPRYIRDQLQLISDRAADEDGEIIAKALDYCWKNKFYSATDFTDALAHFKTQAAGSQVATDDVDQDIKMLDKRDVLNLKIKPQIRDVRVYQQIVSEEMPCTD